MTKQQKNIVICVMYYKKMMININGHVIAISVIVLIVHYIDTFGNVAMMDKYVFRNRALYTIIYTETLFIKTQNIQTQGFV